MKKLLFILVVISLSACSSNAPVEEVPTIDSTSGIEVVDSVITDTIVIDSTIVE